MFDLHDLKQTARNNIGPGQGLSEAIPVGNQRLPVLVFFHFAEREGVPWLGHPAGLVSFHAASGQKIGADRFRSGGNAVPSAAPEVGRRSALCQELRRRFEHAQGLLIPAFFGGVQRLDTRAECQMAGLLLDRWEDATEQGFLSYYRAVGWDWFAWLEMVRAA